MNKQNPMEYKFKRTPTEVKKVNTKHRKILTDIPSPDTIKVLEENLIYEPDSMNYQLPVVWDSAKDYQVFDKSGNCWIDFTSCIFVSNIGHSHPKIQEAIINITNKSLVSSYYYPTKERTELSKLLVKITDKKLNKALLFSTGAESTEVALKMMLLYGKSISNDKNIIISFTNSFHGKTLGSQLMGGKDKEKTWVNVSQNNILHLPFPYPWSKNNDFFSDIGKLLKEKSINVDNIAGIITEPYQGWSATFLPMEYAKQIREWCDKNNILFTIDEVQSGFGRTGKMFAYEHFDIVPDIVCCGKGISSSLPLSAVITNDKIANLDDSFHSTHGGNPVAAACGIASINTLIDENLIYESKRKGKILEDELYKWKKEKPEYIGDIFCSGLLGSVFFKPPINNSIVFVDRLIEIAMQKGLLSVRTGAGTLKIGPPLTIPDDALIEGINVLKESLEELILKLK